MSALPQAFHAVGSKQLLASVWQRNLPLMRERLATLNDIALAAHGGVLTPAARQTGADIAHKLAGSLGMFGYLQGTELARALELLLDSEEPLSSAEVRRLTLQLTQAVPA